jgi:uncharacterized protein (DUF983 family)
MENVTIIPEWKAALHGKCPRCRTGNIFANSMYGLKVQKMHSTCPHCKMRFEKEPGYFYVAMFISYALNVAQMIAFAVLTYFLTGNLEDPFLYMVVLCVTIILLAPVNYRYSRIILLTWLTPGLRFEPHLYLKIPKY